MSISVRKRRFIFCYPLLAGLLMLHAVAAPDRTADPLAPPSLEQVQTQTESVKSDASLDDAQRKTILQNLQQTTDNLTKAQTFTDSASDFAQIIQQAPAGIEAIKQELAAPAAPVDIQPDPAKSVADWEKELLQATADANAARQKLADLESEDTLRASHRSEFPDLLASAKARQTELTDQLSAPSTSSDTSTENPLPAQSVQWVLRSELAATKAAATFYEQQLRDNDIYREWLAAQRDRAARNLSASTARVNALQIQVDRQRQIESKNAETKAAEAVKKAALLHPSIQSIADRNAELAALRTGEDGLTSRLRDANRRLQKSKALTTSILTRKDELQQRMEAAGLTHAVAQLLRRDRDLLPDLRPYHSRIRERRDTIANVQLNLLDLNDERSALLDIDSKAAALAAANSTTEKEQTELAALLTEYLTAQRDQLASLIADNNAYFSTLLELENVEQQLVENVTSFSELIAEHILWVRSDSFIGRTTFGQATDGFEWLVQPTHWKKIVQALWSDILQEPFWIIALLLCELLLIIYYGFAGRRLKTIAAEINRIRTDRFSYTLEAIVHTLLRAAPALLALLFFGWRLNQPGIGDFAQAVGRAFMEVSPYLYYLLSLRDASRPNGLIEAHFGWERAAMKRFRWGILQLIVTCIPLAWIFLVLGNCDVTPEIKALERLVFSLFILVEIAIVGIWLKKKPKTMTKPFSQVQDQRPVKLRQLMLGSALCILTLILAADVVGYYYSALQMWLWFTKSIVLVLLVFMAENLLQRGFRVIARKVEFEQRVKERQEQLRLKEEGGDTAEDLLPEEEEIDVVAISDQTRKLLRAGVRIALFFGLWFIWSSALPALNLLDHVVLWTVQVDSGTGGQTVPMIITLKDLLMAIIAGFLTVVATKHLPGIIELSLLRKLPISYGERYAISTIIRYLIVAAGLIVTFKTLGIGWSKLRLVLAGLSVGLGFGLQEIFANFICGLILLFERPIRVRDYVTVGTTSGQVSRIQIRATTITDWDNKELLIPNKQFITGELINWTLTNPVMRIVIPVGIAYGSDTQKAVRILMEVAYNCHFTIPDPAPNACFVEFGDSSLNFELRVYIASADQWREARHELNMAVDAAFREAGIVIAFPQRDLHIQAVTPAIRPEDIIPRDQAYLA